MRLRLTQKALRFLLLRLRLPFFFFSKFYARHVKSIFIFFSSCCFKRVWTGLEFLIWYAKNVGVLSNHALLIIMPLWWLYYYYAFLRIVIAVEARESGIFFFHHYKDYISTITMPMVTKLDRVVTYHGELLPIKSYDTLIKWSWEDHVTN